MFIDKNSISVNGTQMGQYITEAKYGYNKLWAKDTGRNLAGTYTGSLIGIYPKITLQFRRLTKKELETIAPILDSAYQNVTFYDPTKKRKITIETYASDYEVLNKNIITDSKNKNEAFSVSFVSIRKRG